MVYKYFLVSFALLNDSYFNLTSMFSMRRASDKVISAIPKGNDRPKIKTNKAYLVYLLWEAAPPMHNVITKRAR